MGALPGIRKLEVKMSSAVPSRGFPRPIETAHLHSESQVVVLRGWLYKDDENTDEKDGEVAFSVRCAHPGFGHIANDPRVMPEVCGSHLYMLGALGDVVPVCTPNDWVSPRHEKMRRLWWCVFEYVIDGAPWSRLFLMDDTVVAKAYAPNPHWVLAAGADE